MSRRQKVYDMDKELNELLNIPELQNELATFHRKSQRIETFKCIPVILYTAFLAGCFVPRWLKTFGGAVACIVGGAIVALIVRYFFSYLINTAKNDLFEANQAIYRIIVDNQKSDLYYLEDLIARRLQEKQRANKIVRYILNTLFAIAGVTVILSHVFNYSIRYIYLRRGIGGDLAAIIIIIVIVWFAISMIENFW